MQLALDTPWFTQGACTFRFKSRT